MRLITARMAEASYIRLWLNFKEVKWAFEAELHRWPYIPTWSKVGFYVRDDKGRIETMLVDGETRPKVVYRRGLVWWMDRRPKSLP